MTILGQLPRQHEHFYSCSGVFVAETLMHPLDEPSEVDQRHLHDAGFVVEPDADLQRYAGRPSAIYRTERSLSDQEALDAVYRPRLTGGILPALESSHAMVHATELAPTMRADRTLLINLSGRSDNDMHTVASLEKEVG